MAFQLMLIAALAAGTGQLAPAGGASCTVEPTDAGAVSRSSRGVAQVSNLDLIQLKASVPSRPLPASGVLEGLQAEVTVYQISSKGEKNIVPSAVKSSGGGGDERAEWASFWLDIPLDAAERTAAIRRYLADIGVGPGLQEGAAQSFAGIFRQHRVGRFQIECRVLDQGHLLGSGRVEMEVLDKGRFFDQEAFRKQRKERL